MQLDKTCRLSVLVMSLVVVLAAVVRVVMLHNDVTSHNFVPCSDSVEENIGGDWYGHNDREWKCNIV